ncbi:MAG: hypothetical protein R3C49_19165 [Planctomycetaceae bacterium]
MYPASSRLRISPPGVPSHALLLCRFLPAATALLFLGNISGEDAVPQKSPSDYELMSVFVDAFQQIESNYVRDVDRRELVEAAIRGMMSHLDQYSSYIPPSDVTQFQQIVEQEFGGIGVQVNVRNGQLVVVSPCRRHRHIEPAFVRETSFRKLRARQRKAWLWTKLSGNCRGRSDDPFS